MGKKCFSRITKASPGSFFLFGGRGAGLKAIGELDRVVRRILVYTGSYELEVADGVEVWPMQTLLAALADDRLWP